MVSNFPKRIVICGSGNSIMEGIENGLINVLKYQYTIGINQWHKYADIPTIAGFVDYKWYRDSKLEIRDLPLIVGAKVAEFKDEMLLDNTILLPYSSKYHLGDSWEKGFYKTHLSGFFMLTLALELGFSEIYLLGYDCCEIDGKTHFYQDLIDVNEKDAYGRYRWNGVGKYDEDSKKAGKYKGSYYNTPEQLNKWFDVYNTSDAKIYNVSENSVIDVFPKISYSEFFKKIKNDENKISQTRAREQLKKMILERKI